MGGGPTAGARGPRLSESPLTVGGTGCDSGCGETAPSTTGPAHTPRTPGALPARAEERLCLKTRERKLSSLREIPEEEAQALPPSQLPYGVFTERVMSVTSINVGFSFIGKEWGRATCPMELKRQS